MEAGELCVDEQMQEQTESDARQRLVCRRGTSFPRERVAAVRDRTLWMPCIGMRTPKRSRTRASVTSPAFVARGAVFRALRGGFRGLWGSSRACWASTSGSLSRLLRSTFPETRAADGTPTGPSTRTTRGISAAPYPDAVMHLTTLWMLSPFSAKNGGTLILPGSHRSNEQSKRGKRIRPARRDSRRMQRGRRSGKRADAGQPALARHGPQRFRRAARFRRDSLRPLVARYKRPDARVRRTETDAGSNGAEFARSPARSAVKCMIRCLKR